MIRTSVVDSPNIDRCVSRISPSLSSPSLNPYLVQEHQKILADFEPIRRFSEMFYSDTTAGRLSRLVKLTLQAIQKPPQIRVTILNDFLIRNLTSMSPFQIIPDAYQLAKNECEGFDHSIEVADAVLQKQVLLNKVKELGGKNIYVQSSFYSVIIVIPKSTEAFAFHQGLRDFFTTDALTLDAIEMQIRKIQMYVNHPNEEVQKIANVNLLLLHLKKADLNIQLAKRNIQIRLHLFKNTLRSYEERSIPVSIIPILTPGLGALMSLHMLDFSPPIDHKTKTKWRKIGADLDFYRALRSIQRSWKENNRQQEFFRHLIESLRKNSPSSGPKKTNFLKTHILPLQPLVKEINESKGSCLIPVRDIPAIDEPSETILVSPTQLKSPISPSSPIATMPSTPSVTVKKSLSTIVHHTWNHVKTLSNFCVHVCRRTVIYIPYVLCRKKNQKDHLTEIAIPTPTPSSTPLRIDISATKIHFPEEDIQINTETNQSSSSPLLSSDITLLPQERKYEKTTTHQLTFRAKTKEGHKQHKSISTSSSTASSPITPNLSSGEWTVVRHFKYHQRVRYWLKLPFGASITLPGYATKNAKDAYKDHLHHGFTSQIDELIFDPDFSYHQKLHVNDKVRHVQHLIAEFRYEGQSKWGVISYAFVSGNKICIHRYFSHYSTDDLVNRQLEEIFTEINQTIQHIGSETIESETEISSGSEIEGSTLSRQERLPDPLFGYKTYEDTKLKATIIIFKKRL